MKSKPIWQLALRNFAHFAIDVTIAIIGMIYGFGLTVQNWGVVIGLMFLTRWATSTLHSAWLLDDIKKQAAQAAPIAARNELFDHEVRNLSKAISRYRAANSLSTTSENNSEGSAS